MSAEFPEGDDQVRLVGQALLDVLATTTDDTEETRALISGTLLPDLSVRLADLGAVVAVVDDETGETHIDVSALLAAAVLVTQTATVELTHHTGHDRLTVVHALREKLDEAFLPPAD